MQQPPRVRRFPLGGDLYAYVSPSEHKVELRIGRIQMATDRKGGWTEMEGSDVRLDLKKWRRLVAMERKLTEEFERHQVAWQNFQRGRKRASLQERRNQDKKKAATGERRRRRRRRRGATTTKTNQQRLPEGLPERGGVDTQVPAPCQRRRRAPCQRRAAERRPCQRRKEEEEEEHCCT